MSLLIDDDVISLADMVAIDPEVVDVATAEGITITGDTGIVRQAWDESADALLDAMQSFSGDVIGWPGSVTSIGTFGTNKSRINLNQIVASAIYGRRESPLKRWMVYQALYLFYRAASNRTIKDRYETKAERFSNEVKRRWQMVWSTGIPVVALPLAAPGALHDYLAGSFGASNVSATAGGASSQLAVKVAITWMDQGGYQNQQSKGNAESGPSAAVAFTIPSANRLTVNTNGLIPPGSVSQPSRGVADGPYISRAATGWNLYVGDPTDPNGAMYLQNASPLPIATTSVTLTSAPLFSGSMLQPGQFPDANYTFQKMLHRG